MKKIVKKAISITLASAVTVSAGAYSGIVNITPAVINAYDIPSVTNVKQTDLSPNSISLSWSGNSSTVSYEVSYREDTDTDTGYEYTVAGQTTETSYTLSGLKAGCLYDIRITPKSSEGETGISGVLFEAKTQLEGVHELKQETWYHYAEDAAVSWKSEKAADGYEYIWTSPSGKKIKQDKVNTTYLSFNIKNHNIYKFSLRAYQDIDGKTTYTPWETIQVFEQPWLKGVYVKNLKKGKKQLRINWYKQHGATGYEVYVSKTNTEGSYKKVASVGKNRTSLSLNKFKGKKIRGTYFVYIVSKTTNEYGTSRSGIVYVWQTGEISEKYLYTS